MYPTDRITGLKLKKKKGTRKWKTMLEAVEYNHSSEVQLLNREFDIIWKE